MKYNQLNWRDVFDTDKRWYGHISGAMDTSRLAGYEYFCWNGTVYRILNEFKCIKVGLVEEVK